MLFEALAESLQAMNSYYTNRIEGLHTHLVFHRLGLTQGLWSPMRGLARQQDEYYARLNNADLPRRNDLDGRGQLSQEELVKFADFFWIFVSTKCAICVR